MSRIQPAIRAIQLGNMMRGQTFYTLLHIGVDTFSPYYGNTQYRELLVLATKYLLLLAKNYVSKQLISSTVA
jgi:hypothetical protein